MNSLYDNKTEDAACSILSVVGLFSLVSLEQTVQDVGGLPVDMHLILSAEQYRTSDAFERYLRK